MITLWWLNQQKMAKQASKHKMAVAAKMRCRTPKHGIPFRLKTENCVESTKSMLLSCIVNLLQRTNNGILFSFVQSVGRVKLLHEDLRNKGFIGRDQLWSPEQSEGDKSRVMRAGTLTYFSYYTLIFLLHTYFIYHTLRCHGLKYDFLSSFFLHSF